MRRVALVAGGTAGHVYPALEVARAYRHAVPNASVLFIGASGGFESRLVTAHGYRLELVPAAPVFGVGVAGKTLALARLLSGARRARQLLRADSIQLVIGFGGYASAGTLLAARMLGLRSAIFEPNAAPGLTNRLLGRVADRVYLGSAAARPAFASTKALVTGIPVRPEIARVGAERQPRADDRVRVLVTGGSLGSAFLNRQAPDLLARVARGGVALEVQHQAGACDLAAVRQAYERAGLSARVTPYIDRMPDLYAWADFAVTCAGAGTLAELAASGLPALVVPLHSASEDHQIANARAFAAASDGWWVREQDWRPEALAGSIAELLTHADAWTAASQRLRQQATADAAALVVADCEAQMDAPP